MHEKNEMEKRERMDVKKTKKRIAQRRRIMATRRRRKKMKDAVKKKINCLLCYFNQQPNQKKGYWKNKFFRK